MTTLSVDDLKQLVVKHCGVDEASISKEDHLALVSYNWQLISAKYVWKNPAKIKEELEIARTKIRDAISAIEDLDNYAKSLARMEAGRDERERHTARIIELTQNEPIDRPNIALEEYLQSYQPPPKEEWVDHAALAKMRDLEIALQYPLEFAIPNAVVKRGPKPNRAAYSVAEIACVLYIRFTGKKPGFRKGGETPFSRLVTDLYQVLQIYADLKKPIVAALSKHFSK